MESGTTEIAGIIIRSDDPLFLTVVGLHLLAGLTAVIAGLVAMFSPKRRGRHSQGGNVYFWSITGVFATAAALAFLRGPENFHLFALGTAALALTCIGRAARRGRWQNSLRSRDAAVVVTAEAMSPSLTPQRVSATAKAWP